MLFNQAYDGSRIYDLSSSLNIHEMIKSIVPDEIIVCVGPSQYTSCRRNMSLALAWSYGKNMSVYGFNILRHVMKFDKCFYAKDKLCWIKNGDEYRVVRVNELSDLTGYVGNMEINGSKSMDCSIDVIWQMMSELRYELKQEYCDVFQS